MITRRHLLAVSTASLFRSQWDHEVPSLLLGAEPLDRTYTAALATLRGNVQPVTRFSRPVLLEGAEYPGVWLECAPLEGLAYGVLAPEVAISNHDVFFELQREDGYLPCSVKKAQVGTGQIQMVVPIAATALEVYRSQKRAAFLERAYGACSRWDDWLMRYRNTRGTGLCEAFCTYDTGHDNSPRFAGMPNRCPENDARLCPRVKGLPYLAPDLSATVYGGRMALAAIAREMGRNGDEARWQEQAQQIRQTILERLYDPDTHAFYDLDSDNQFVKIRGDLISRVLGEHVPDRKLFEEVYRAQIRDPRAFWSRYPLPSVAMDDPKFIRPIPRNSWGGASQALTALRAPRWMEHYGKHADLSYLMTQWTDAIVRNGGFFQQMDPDTGEFIGGKPGYSPAALVFLEFCWRLYGVRAESGTLEWNCRLPAASRTCIATLKTANGTAQLRTNPHGSELLLAGKRVAQVKGTARLVTEADGRPLSLIATAPHRATVRLQRWGRDKQYALRSDETIDVRQDFT